MGKYLLIYHGGGAPATDEDREKDDRGLDPVVHRARAGDDRPGQPDIACRDRRERRWGE